jgi:pyridinium-3,5-biscarboxylic acid mononucleotide sulfurtransferase
MNELATKRDRLLALLAEMPGCVVAYSGGVDSAVVAKAAHLALGSRALAVTGVSASLAEGELDEACRIAEQIGIRHVVLQTNEFASDDYVRNAPDRCYHCKSELYSQISRRLAEWGNPVVVNGANADDLDDYRPGMSAAAEHEIRSPLAECSLTKAEVRELAAGWQLPVWNKPATPCLSSRVAYGESVTPERLQMIDQAERYLREKGFASLRVRYHAGDVARIEAAPADLARFCDLPFRSELIARLKVLGFKFITVDLEGFRSGSLNQLVSIGDASRAKA